MANKAISWAELTGVPGHFIIYQCVLTGCHVDPCVACYSLVSGAHANLFPIPFLMGSIKLTLDEILDRALGASAAVAPDDIDDGFPEMKMSVGEGRGRGQSRKPGLQ
jgi:hypothetical protein